MKRQLTVKALIFPLLIAFALLLPLLGAAVIGEHRYEKSHPAYLRHFWLYLLGEQEADGEIPTAATSDRMNVLVVGKDRAAGLTDVMMLACMDTQSNALQLIQIPRDTYAAYTSRDYKKINGAYTSLGGEELKRFLGRAIGVPIDRYVCVELDVLGRLVDEMGGVRMVVPTDMDYDDPAQDLHIHIKAGEQVLDGQTAQSFVRFRSGYAEADIGRMDAQKIFLSALAKQAKENLSLSQSVGLVCSSFGKVKTDMGLGDCLELVKYLRAVDLSRMNMATLPGASAREDGTSGAWYYILNRDAAASLVRRLLDSTAVFDPDGVFDHSTKRAFHRIYTAPADSVSIHEYTAQGALDGHVAVKGIG